MMIARVALDELPDPLVAALGGAAIHIAFHLPETNRYVVSCTLRSGQSQEIEYDVALGRPLTTDERRGELPPPRRDELADEGVVFVTSYRIDDTTFHKVVHLATEDGRVAISQLAHHSPPPDGAQLIRDELQRQQFPAEYATWSHEQRIAHWAYVIHRWRRVNGESSREEDEVYTPELVTDLERIEPNLRDMLGEILGQVGWLEQTPAAEAIAAFTARTGIAIRPADALRRSDRGLHLADRDRPSRTGIAVRPADASRRSERGLRRPDRDRPSMSEWVEIPGGRFVLGLLPDEVDALANASLLAARVRLEHPDAGLRDLREFEEKTGNLDYLRPLIARAFPAREVELAPFAIARTPVTNRDWKRFLADAKLPPPDRWRVPGADADDRAVIDVSWDEASRYAAWAGAALPGEVQWERAARSTARRLFPWGDAWGAQGTWLDAQPYYDPWSQGTHAELASPDGMHDAITRRWEWCADEFTASDVASLEALYPGLSADGRVRRGGEGAWLIATAVARTGTDPGWRADGTGFRLVRGSHVAR